MHKQIKLHRRAQKTRARIRQQGAYRLCVHRTLNHIYAQIISPCGSRTIASASSLEKEMRTELQNSGKKEVATVIGKRIAERAIQAGIKKVAFDRSGFKYHGRLKALAEAARESGIEF